MQFTVNGIEAHSPAAYSQIQVGDRLRMVSSAFDGDAASSLWQAARQQDRVRTATQRSVLGAVQMQEALSAGNKHAKLLCCVEPGEAGL